MGIKRGFALGCVLSVAVCVSFQFSQAYDLLFSAEHFFFRDPGARRFGIEVEYKGLSLADSCQLVKAHLKGQGMPTPTPDRECRISSRYGEIVIKIEQNQTTDEETPESEWVTEIVLPPLTFEKVVELQAVMYRLQASGARGTSPKTPVSIQVNMEFNPTGDKAEIEFKNFVNLLKNYAQVEHRRQALQVLNVPAVRKPYLQELSPGFLSRLLRYDYQPTPEELHFDLLYRQTLELLGDHYAWSMTEEMARRKIAELDYPIVPEVVKTNILRYSSLVMHLVPDDPYTREIHQAEWAVPRPLVEFREPNNDFDIVTPTKWAYGLLAATEDYGVFNHDNLLTRLTGLSHAKLKELRDRRCEQLVTP